MIAIDGPGGSGKGTVSRRIAALLGFHLLDSGVLYRLVGLSAQQRHVALDDESGLAHLAATLDVEFDVAGAGEPRVRLDGSDVTAQIRSETAGLRASTVATLPAVRHALVGRQRAFAVAPGLVADGRDMGSVIFPDAVLKVFLTASPVERARRRVLQLAEQGIAADIDAVAADIAARDHKDATRAVAPLRAVPDALVLDTTSMPVDAVVEEVLRQAACRGIAAVSVK